MIKPYSTKIGCYGVFLQTSIYLSVKCYTFFPHALLHSFCSLLYLLLQSPMFTSSSPFYYFPSLNIFLSIISHLMHLCLSSFLPYHCLSSHTGSNWIFIENIDICWLQCFEAAHVIQIMDPCVAVCGCGWTILAADELAIQRS